MKKLIAAFIVSAMVATLSGCGDDNDKTVRLYGVTHGESELVKLDPNTGELIETIGPVGYKINGLEYDHTTNKLYATTSSGDGTLPDALIVIDRSTGEGTPVVDASGLDNVMLPTVNSAGDMFAWSDDGDGYSDDLVSFDKATGLATWVGDADIETWQNGLAFDNSDRLILFNGTDEGNNDVYEINTDTGEAVLLGEVTNEYNAHHGDFHPKTGLYWGIDVTADYGTVLRNINVVDIDLLEITDTLPTVDRLHAISFFYD